MSKDEQRKRVAVLVHLEKAIQAAGYTNVKLVLTDETTVEVFFRKNYSRQVNIEGDSPMAMMEDILEQAF